MIPIAIARVFYEASLKYFANTIQNASLGYLENELSVVCILINRYQSPVAISRPEGIRISEKISTLLNQQNQIQTVNNNCY